MIIKYIFLLFLVFLGPLNLIFSNSILHFRNSGSFTVGVNKKISVAKININITKQSAWLNNLDIGVHVSRGKHSLVNFSYTNRREVYYSALANYTINFSNSSIQAGLTPLASNYFLKFNGYFNNEAKQSLLAYPVLKPYYNVNYHAQAYPFSVVYKVNILPDILTTSVAYVNPKLVLSNEQPGASQNIFQYGLNFYNEHKGVGYGSSIILEQALNQAYQNITSFNTIEYLGIAAHLSLIFRNNNKTIYNGYNMLIKYNILKYALGVQYLNSNSNKLHNVQYFFDYQTKAKYIVKLAFMQQFARSTKAFHSVAIAIDYNFRK